jgi:hypothetical protein
MNGIAVYEMSVAMAAPDGPFIGIRTRFKRILMPAAPKDI